MGLASTTVALLSAPTSWPCRLACHETVVGGLPRVGGLGASPGTLATRDEPGLDAALPSIAGRNTAAQDRTMSTDEPALDIADTEADATSRRLPAHRAEKSSRFLDNRSRINDTPAWRVAPGARSPGRLGWQPGPSPFLRHACVVAAGHHGQDLGGRELRPDHGTGR